MSTFTTNIGLEQPINGADADTWDVPVNADWALIDQALGTSTTKAFTNVDITLSVADAAFFQIICTGVLSGNVNLIFPSAIGGRRVIFNQCTGAFTLKAKNGAGDTGVVIGQGYQTPILLTAGTAYYDAYTSTPPGAANLTAAATTDLGSVPQGEISILGTASITSLGSSAPVGMTKFLAFGGGGATLVYDATALILPSSASIVTVNGDTAIATCIATGNWRVSFFQRRSGLALVVGAGVSSFNGRQNVVVPATDDYTTAELTTASSSTPPSTGRLGEALTSTGTSSLNVAPMTNVCSINLSAGHWLCFASCSIVNSSQAVFSYGGSISLVSGTLGAGYFQWQGLSIPANNNFAFAPPNLIVRTNGAVVYLGMWANNAPGLGTGTLTAIRID